MSEGQSCAACRGISCGLPMFDSARKLFVIKRPRNMANMSLISGFFKSVS